MWDGGESGPSVSSETWPVAKIPHKCCECGRTILPGEKYQRVFGVWDEAQTFKTCSDCAGRPREWLQANCDGWLFECALEDLREHIDTFPDDRELMECVWGIQSQWGRKDPELVESIA